MRMLAPTRTGTESGRSWTRSPALSEELPTSRSFLRTRVSPVIAIGHSFVPALEVGRHRDRGEGARIELAVFVSSGRSLRRRSSARRSSGSTRSRLCAGRGRDARAEIDRSATDAVARPSGGAERPASPRSCKRLPAGAGLSRRGPRRTQLPGDAGPIDATNAVARSRGPAHRPSPATAASDKPNGIATREYVASPSLRHRSGSQTSVVISDDDRRQSD